MAYAIENKTYCLETTISASSKAGNMRQIIGNLFIDLLPTYISGKLPNAKHVASKWRVISILKMYLSESKPMEK